MWPLVENEATMSQALREPEKDGDRRRSGQETSKSPYRGGEYFFGVSYYKFNNYYNFSHFTDKETVEWRGYLKYKLLLLMFSQ